MIIPMVIAKKNEFLRIALIATIFSVLGALFGYLIGYVFFNDIVVKIFELYLYEDPNFLKDKFEDINLAAINAAIQAREECGRDDVLVAGSLSHQIPYEDAFRSQKEKDKYIKKLTPEYFQKSFDELAFFLADNGCDFILLELMYRPDRIDIIFDSASKVGLPVWAGFSSRNKDGLIALTTDYEYSFKKMISNVKHHKLDAVGIMHCDIGVIEESIKELKEVYDLPIMAYPEVAVFKFPHYDMSNVIPPDDYLIEAKKWKDAGAQIIGGCCGTTVEHIKLLNQL